jgi:hypothetical protein
MRVSLFFCAFLGLFFLSSKAYGEKAIEIDQTAPTLEYVPGNEPVKAGKPLEISVRASDNVRIATVTLFYRREEETEFHSAEMVNTDHDNFSLIIPGDQIFGKKLEYYFVAEDEAGNRTMKGFSGTPLSFHIIPPDKPPSTLKSEALENQVRKSPVSFNEGVSRKSSLSKFSIKLLAGESLFRFSEQGNQIPFSSFSYGLEGEFRYRENRAWSIGVIQSQAETVEAAPVSYQNLTGTLYESFNATSFSAGQRVFYRHASVLVGLNVLYGRLTDRNLLNSAGFRIARFSDDSYALPGFILGVDWNFPVAKNIRIGFAPRLNLFFSGQFNHILLPGVIDYAF